jgi:hypothetical protein
MTPQLAEETLVRLLMGFLFREAGKPSVLGPVGAAAVPWNASASGV